jgi:Cu+-exporting ATPase
MDTLVAMGSTTAYGYSLWALLSGHGGHLYFMEAAAIITLISLGHWIEARVSAKASSALRQLLDLAPPTARRVVNGAEQEASVADLNSGDVIILRPGDRVPTDGAVVEGESAVDEAMLTGESVPVEKSPGSDVYAGTVNASGRLLIRVTATGEETALAHVIAAVQRAQTSRANIQRLGDRVSSVFVPIVIGIAIAAGLWWAFAPEHARQVSAWLGQYLWPPHAPAGTLASAFIVAAAVLIIACPCAMGLATPAAIMAGSNAAAQRGILIRDGVALEKAGTITGVVFDKTGTLTTGHPTVVASWPPASSPDFHSTARIASGLAQHSKHPISQAIATLSDSAASVQDWREVEQTRIKNEFQMAFAKNLIAKGFKRSETAPKFLLYENV